MLIEVHQADRTFRWEYYRWACMTAFLSNSFQLTFLVMEDRFVLLFEFEEDSAHGHWIDSEVNWFTSELLDDAHVHIIILSAALILPLSIPMAMCTSWSIIFIGVHHSLSMLDVNIIVFFNIISNNWNDRVAYWALGFISNLIKPLLWTLCCAKCNRYIRLLLIIRLGLLKLL